MKGLYEDFVIFLNTTLNTSNLPPRDEIESFSFYTNTNLSYYYYKYLTFNTFLHS